MAESGMTARRVVYVGRVQGVGFRATARSIARRHPVAGFVRNLADGSVELVASGDAAALDAFLNEVQARFDANIDRAELSEFSGPAEFNGFDIRH